MPPRWRRALRPPRHQFPRSPNNCGQRREQKGTEQNKREEKKRREEKRREEKKRREERTEVEQRRQARPRARREEKSILWNLVESRGL